jgi:membrane-associated protease RseP (regulator of RpoE activity)
MRKRISSAHGLLLLFTMLVIGIALVIYSTILVGHGLILSLVQAAVFLAGALVVWYPVHALSHFLTAKMLGVRTRYFYVGRSELRNANVPLAKNLASRLVTVGTKLDERSLKLVSKKARGFIFGSGAIVSTCAAALIFLFAILAKLNLLSEIFAFLFFAFSLGSELFLSTKSGDLSKMKRELA